MKFPTTIAPKLDIVPSEVLVHLVKNPQNKLTQKAHATRWRLSFACHMQNTYL